MILGKCSEIFVFRVNGLVFGGFFLEYLRLNLEPHNSVVHKVT